MSSPFNTEINDLKDIVYEVYKRKIACDDIQFYESLLDFFKSEMDYRKEIRNKTDEIFKFAGTGISGSFRKILFLEIKNNLGRIDEINVIGLTKNIKNVSEFSKQTFINLWQSFLELKKECEVDLRKKFRKIYQTARTINCNSQNNKFQEIVLKLKEGYDKIIAGSSMIYNTLKAIHSAPEGEYTCMDGRVIKGRNITNRIKNENDQLQGALAEFSFPGEKMATL